MLTIFYLKFEQKYSFMNFIFAYLLFSLPKCKILTEYPKNDNVGMHLKIYKKYIKKFMINTHTYFRQYPLYHEHKMFFI